MKLIIAGGRNLPTDRDFVEECLYMHEIEEKVTEVVSGRAKGADKAGESYALQFDNYDPPTRKMELALFPADWDKFGRGAGHIRNQEMAVYADALLLIWDGESKGSANMKERMLKLNKPVYEVILKSYNVEEEEL